MKVSMQKMIISNGTEVYEVYLTDEGKLCAIFYCISKRHATDLMAAFERNTTNVDVV